MLIERNGSGGERIGGSLEGRAVERAPDGTLEGRVHALDDAQFVQCEACLCEVSRDDIHRSWFGGFESNVCHECHVCPPDVDREIDAMRGK